MTRADVMDLRGRTGGKSIFAPTVQVGGVAYWPESIKCIRLAP